MGGKFKEGAKLGAKWGAAFGVFRGVTTSEQFQNWRAGKGFVRNSIANKPKITAKIGSDKIFNTDAKVDSWVEASKDRIDYKVGDFNTGQVASSATDLGLDNNIDSFDFNGDGIQDAQLNVDKGGWVYRVDMDTNRNGKIDLIWTDNNRDGTIFNNDGSIQDGEIQHEGSN